MPSAKEEKSKSERFGETNENARRSDLNRLKVLAGLKKDERYETKPDDFEGVVQVQGGFLRYRKKKYSLASGILSIFATTNTDIKKFEIDLAISCVSYNAYKKYLSINTEQDVHYIRINDRRKFDEFLEHLRVHRLYRQNFLLYSQHSPPKVATSSTNEEKIEKKAGDWSKRDEKKVVVYAKTLTSAKEPKIVDKVTKSKFTLQKVATTEVSSFDQLKNLHMRAEALALDLRVAYERIERMPNSSEIPEVNSIKKHWQIVSLVQSKLDAILKPHRQSSMYHAESLNRLAQLRVQLHENQPVQRKTIKKEENKSAKGNEEQEEHNDAEA